MATPLDATQTDPRHGGPSFSLGNRAVRAIWSITWLLLAAWTPSPFSPWRRLLLRLFGAKLVAPCDVRASARVWYPPHLSMARHSQLAAGVVCYNMAPVSLGEGALVSQRAVLCAGTHDIDHPDFQLVARPISIGADAWVASEAFVGPGVTIGEGAVLGARAVAFRDLEPWAVYVGNPAVAMRRRRRSAP